MKTKFFLLILTLVSFSVFSQNITNTLGSSGVFTIKDGTTNYLSLSQSTGQLNIFKTLRFENTTNATTGVIFQGVDRFSHNYGINNTFFGTNSGNFTLSGAYNTGVGKQTLQNITIGSRNTAVGYSSLNNITTGSSNIAIGYNALFSNTEGYSNTAFGNSSLFLNITGKSNTALGDLSLYYNTEGSNNIAVGYYSLLQNKSSNNTAVGYRSLNNNTTGYENTAIGCESLFTNTTNSGNTAVGWNALYLSTGWQNTAVGHHSMNSNTTGNYNTAIGYNSGSSITTGLNLTCIGIDANPTSPTAFDQVTLGNGFISSLRCNVTTITSLSDMRDKKNIQDLSLGLDFIVKLRPRQFNWDKREWYENNNSDGSKIDTNFTAGFIAQEFDEVQITENAEWLKLVLKDNPEKWEATPGNLLPIMVKAIQELKAENDVLKNNNEKLSAEIESMKIMAEKLSKLEQMVNEMAAVKNTSLSESK